MNPLRFLFKKVKSGPPPAEAPATAPVEEPAFEWNPEEHDVGPAPVAATSWRRRDTPDDGPRRVHGEATDADIAASAQNLPPLLFDRHDTPDSSGRGALLGEGKPAERARPRPGAGSPRRRSATEAVLTASREAIIPRESPLGTSATPSRAASRDDRFGRTGFDPKAQSAPPAEGAPISIRPPESLSEFEDVYQRAGIELPAHGVGVERVHRLLTSPRLADADRSMKRGALRVALDAAGVPPSDVLQDAVFRLEALAAHESEATLELHELKARIESRIEALQDTVEIVTRRKQSHIDRLAMGGEGTLSAQSDFEIRKQAEQDRLYRSLICFLEPVRSSSTESAPTVETPARKEESRPPVPPPLAPTASVDRTLVNQSTRIPPVAPAAGITVRQAGDATVKDRPQTKKMEPVIPAAGPAVAPAVTANRDPRTGSTIRPRTVPLASVQKEAPATRPATATPRPPVAAKARPGLP